MSEHIKHIFDDEELSQESVVRHFRTTDSDEKACDVAYYNLDMVISLGFRARRRAASSSPSPHPKRAQIELDRIKRS